MRKNRLMRLASVLLVLTLLTTSVIGGTFAKYVTTDSATDTARVAKWGIVASVSGDLFGSSYVNKTGGNSITTWSLNGETVSAGAATDKVVAPGTENTTGLTLAVTGEAEVSSKVTITMPAEADKPNSDICLKAGTYGVMVEYEGAKTKENIVNYYTKGNDGVYTKATADTATTSEVYELVDWTDSIGSDYHPLKWYVNNGEVASLDVVEDSLTTIFDGKPFTPNTPLNIATTTVGWKWPFGTAGAPNGNDTKDTILGNMIASKMDVDDLSSDTDIPNEPVVVKLNSTSSKYETVKYTDVGTIAVAYTGATAPSTVGDASVCACLTAAFGVSLTVEQVD